MSKSSVLFQTCNGEYKQMKTEMEKGEEETSHDRKLFAYFTIIEMN